MPRHKGHKKGAPDSKGTAEAAKPVSIPEANANKTPSGARQVSASLETLEAERQKVLEQLRGVEDQVFKLETKYFQLANPYGNALKGYHGLLDLPPEALPPEAKLTRSTPVLDEERWFSGSSVSGAAASQQVSEENAP